MRCRRQATRVVIVKLGRVRHLKTRRIMRGNRFNEQWLTVPLLPSLRPPLFHHNRQPLSSLRGDASAPLFLRGGLLGTGLPASLATGSRRSRSDQGRDRTRQPVPLFLQVCHYSL